VKYEDVTPKRSHAKTVLKFKIAKAAKDAILSGG
jgi:hypothetical protein